MTTSSKLVLGMAVAIITAPALAAGPMNSSAVWTTTNGSAILDSSGNAVRTIHYLDKALTAAKKPSKSSTSLVAVIKKAVAEAFNKEPESEEMAIVVPVPVIVKEVVEVELVQAMAIVNVTEDEPEPEPTEEAVVAVAAEEPEIVVTDPVVEAPVEQVKVVYTFNDYVASILFDTNSSALTADGTGSLTQLAMATKQAESIVSVKLTGYADSRGDPDYNMALSKKRMLTVEEFLSGLTLNVTSRFAKGESSPILGTDGEDLALSRRVDVAIKTRHIKD